MKEIEIQNEKFCYYNIPRRFMSLVDEVISDTSMKVNQQATNCRELLIHKIIKSINNPVFKNHYCKKHLSKLRVIFYNTGLSEDEISNVLLFINHIEDKHNIPKTMVSKANVGIYNLPESRKEAPKFDRLIPTTYLFEGDETWLHSSVLVSLFLLILRFNIINYKKLQEESIVTVDDLSKFIEIDDNYKNIECIEDFKNIKDTFKHWDMVLSSRDVLFPPAKSLIDYYNIRNIHNDNKNDSAKSWEPTICSFGISMLVDTKARSDYRNFNAYKAFHKLLN